MEAHTDPGPGGYTRAELLALPAVVPLWPVAARALGLGRTKAFDLVRAGEFPCRVVRLGTRVKVPTDGLLAVLGVRRDVSA